MTEQPHFEASAPSPQLDHDLSSLRCNHESVDQLFNVCTPSQAAALGLLAQAHVHQLNAAPFLTRLAAETPVTQSILLKQVASQLDRGASLIEAVEHEPRILPASVLLAFRFASDSGTLNSLCSSIALRPIFVPEETGASHPAHLGKLIWLCGNCFFLFSVMAFVMLFIIPQFQEMFTEFGIELPAVTIILMNVASFFCQWWFVFFGLLTAVALPYINPLYQRVARRLSPSTWRQQTHPASVESRLNLARMTESGMEPAHGLTQMLQHAGRKKGTAQIKRARQRVIDGQDHWKALSIEGVLTKREADAMHSATSSETQTWLLRQMATAHANRVSTWSVTRFRVFTGIAQILFGLLVLLFCVGLFAPLVYIIEGLAGG